MGANQRYADALQRRRFNREAEARALVPRSLTSAEIGSDPVQYGRPVPVRAWIEFGAATAQVEGFATAWTRRAVLVLW